MASAMRVVKSMDKKMNSYWNRWVIKYLFFTPLLIIASMVFVRSVSAGSASRSMNPTSYTPGAQIVVTVTVTTNTPGEFIYGVEETVPDNWTVSNVSHQGIIFTVGLKKLIKWGLFVGTDSLNASSTNNMLAVSRTLTYTAQPPSTENVATDPEAF